MFTINQKPDYLRLDYPCDVVFNGVQYPSVADAIRHTNSQDEMLLVGLLLQKFGGSLGGDLVRLPDRMWAEYEPYSWWKHGLLKMQRGLTVHGAALARVVMLLRVRNLHRDPRPSVDA